MGKIIKIIEFAIMNYEVKTNGWKKGVTFLRAINICGNFRRTKEKMLDLCKKKDIHYATVGAKLEKVLSSHFKKSIYVTTRSMKTIRSLLQ